MTSREAYIEVGDVKHYWCEDSMFIFDDTLLHQSFNETDEPRYCLFVDILRPALSPVPFKLVMDFIRLAMQGGNQVFYKNWDVIKGKPDAPKPETIQVSSERHLTSASSGNGVGR
jgi:beta-hydroxylase